MKQELLEKARSGRHCVLVPDRILNYCRDMTYLEYIFDLFVCMDTDDYEIGVLYEYGISEGTLIIVNNTIAGVAMHFYPNTTGPTLHEMPT